MTAYRTLPISFDFLSCLSNSTISFAGISAETKHIRHGVRSSTKRINPNTNTPTQPIIIVSWSHWMTAQSDYHHLLCTGSQPQRKQDCTSTASLPHNNRRYKYSCTQLGKGNRVDPLHYTCHVFRLLPSFRGDTGMPTIISVITYLGGSRGILV